MRHKRTFIGLVSAFALVIGQALPAGAASLASSSQSRESLRNRKAAIAAKLNTLNASDDQLQSALDTLNSQVRAQESAANDAKQAADAADARYNTVKAELDKTNARIAGLRQAMVSRAVDAYTQGDGSEALGQFAGTEDVNDVSRKTAVLDGITERDTDLADALRAAKQDQEQLEHEAGAAQSSASKKKKELTDALNKAVADRNEKARVANAVNARIKDYQKESREIASQESRLNGITGGGGRSDGPRPISSHGLMWPVSGPLTSGFGYRWGRLHAGIDIGVPIGTPIHAAKGGTVSFSGTMSGYGNVVVINHGGGFSTLYAHQSRTGVRVGQSVSQGQIIGWSGNTGSSTGPHVHFETRVNGSPQNPLNYL